MAWATTSAGSKRSVGVHRFAQLVDRAGNGRWAVGKLRCAASSAHLAAFTRTLVSCILASPPAAPFRLSRAPLLSSPPPRDRNRASLLSLSFSPPLLRELVFLVLLLLLLLVDVHSSSSCSCSRALPPPRPPPPRAAAP